MEVKWSQVYVKSGDNAGAATYSLSIPDEAASGDYEVVLRAFAGAEAEDTLTLKLKVAAEEIRKQQLRIPVSGAGGRIRDQLQL